jgi:hypothetical protein
MTVKVSLKEIVCLCYPAHWNPSHSEMHPPRYLTEVILSHTSLLPRRLEQLDLCPRCSTPYHSLVLITEVSFCYYICWLSYLQFAEFLATGVVILISIAIAAGVVFLLALIGILWALFSRRREQSEKLSMVDEDDDDSTNQRPSSMLEHINAATRATIYGGSSVSPFAAFSEKDGEKRGHLSPTNDHDPFGPDASNYLRNETPSDMGGGMLGEEQSRPAHARYSFDGAGEGELPLTAGAEVEVLDDRDAA